jgi:CRISPR-associated endonuclease/helicase Cas3
MLSDEERAANIAGEKQALCIVNSRKQAQAIYSLLGGAGAYHLSTMMTPHDRRAVLEEIRHKLSAGEPCRVVSTSLVEAGVDVDFPAVYRSVAGIDSIIQAGGRCNREGLRPADSSTVHIFDTGQRPPDIIRQNIAAAQRVMRDFEDISAPDAVKAYFDFLLYTLKDKRELDSKDIMRGIEAGEMPFAWAAERFHIIESAENTVYIPFSGGAELIRRLRSFGSSRSLLRELGQYAVGVYPRHFQALIDTGSAERIPGLENTAVLLDGNLYSAKPVSLSASRKVKACMYKWCGGASAPPHHL